MVMVLMRLVDCSWRDLSCRDGDGAMVINRITVYALEVLESKKGLLLRCVGFLNRRKSLSILKA
jgi:hypothetical protein